jgi:hypothetical protein
MSKQKIQLLLMWRRTPRHLLTQLQPPYVPFNQAARFAVCVTVVHAQFQQRSFPYNAIMRAYLIETATAVNPILSKLLRCDNGHCGTGTESWLLGSACTV